MEGIIAAYDPGGKKIGSAGDQPLPEDVFAIQGTSRTSSDPFLNLTVPAEVHEVMVTVDDPDTFNAPWQATHRYRRIQRPTTYEEVCAENNQQMFDYRIPVANKPDF